MSMKIFIYPSIARGNIGINPYLKNLKKSLEPHCEVCTPRNKVKLPPMLVFLLHCWKSDAYVLNWIEDAAFGKLKSFGAIICLVGLKIIHIRKAKIIWIFHNIHPHKGETFWSVRIKKFLFTNSTFIVSHSEAGANYAIQHAKCPVFFKNHPIKEVNYDIWEGNVRECDFFYWSYISPYKGILEFLSNPLCKLSGKKIFILGKSSTETIRTEINIIYENRQADFCEIAAQCRTAKYVIFPYIGDSISSSGVLMDTLLMGGTPVGPNRGAFADLAAQGCCLTYESIDEIFYLPTDITNQIKLDPVKVNSFIKKNTWTSFGQWMYNMIYSQKE